MYGGKASFAIEDGAHSRGSVRRCSDAKGSIGRPHLGFCVLFVGSFGTEPLWRVVRAVASWHFGGLAHVVR